MNKYAALFNEVSQQDKDYHDEMYQRYHRSRGMHESWGIPYEVSEESQQFALQVNSYAENDNRVIEALYQYFTDRKYDSVKRSYAFAVFGKIDPDESEQAYCLYQFLLFSYYTSDNPIDTEKRICEVLKKLFRSLTKESLEAVNATLNAVTSNPNDFPLELKRVKALLANVLMSLDNLSVNPDLSSDEKSLILRCKTDVLDKLVRITPLDLTRLTLNKQERLNFESLHCPISHDIMSDPITVSSGQTYDRASLRGYFEFQDNPTTVPCPLTRRRIQITELEQPTDANVKNKITNFIHQQKTKEVLSHQKSIEFREILRDNRVDNHNTPSVTVSFEPRAKAIKTEEQAMAYVTTLFERHHVTLADSLVENESRYRPQNKPYSRNVGWLQTLEENNLLSQEILQTFRSNLFFGNCFVDRLKKSELLTLENLTHFCDDHGRSIIECLSYHPDLLNQDNLTAIIDSGVAHEALASQLKEVVFPNVGRSHNYLNQENLDRMIANPGASMNP